MFVIQNFQSLIILDAKDEKDTLRTFYKKFKGVLSCIEKGVLAPLKKNDNNQIFFKDTINAHRPSLKISLSSPETLANILSVLQELPQGTMLLTVSGDSNVLALEFESG
uniref:Uncharacterized protein n=1 Tax=viral metagenome TaxID=1070528 RepID=A0A6C0KTY1_9ZZZZ